MSARPASLSWRAMPRNPHGPAGRAVLLALTAFSLLAAKPNIVLIVADDLATATSCQEPAICRRPGSIRWPRTAFVSPAARLVAGLLPSRAGLLTDAIRPASGMRAMRSGAEPRRGRRTAADGADPGRVAQTGRVQDRLGRQVAFGRAPAGVLNAGASMSFSASSTKAATSSRGRTRACGLGSGSRAIPTVRPRACRPDRSCFPITWARTSRPTICKTPCFAATSP